MRNGDKRIFTDKAILKEMLNLRKSGMPLLKIAKKYGCHHTSIIYQCRKNKIKNEKRS